MKDDNIIKSELFATDELARAALKTVLDRHKKKGRVVREIWDGPALRFEIDARDGFVGAFWLSAGGESE